MSQETLATRAKVSRNYVGNVERAERMIAIDTLDRFAQILDVSLAEFFAPFRRR
jgi:transcriptional regulator with XRE-family HTH domain